MSNHDQEKTIRIDGAHAAGLTAKLLARDVFTTGQIAKICRVSDRKVTQWIDSGQLPGYVIPPAGHRRVQRSRLIIFLEKHGMPTFGLVNGEAVSS